MTDGERIESTPVNSQSIENPRVVSAALACAWFAVGSVVVGMGLILGLENSHSGFVLVPIIATLMFLQIPSVVAALVLSILGGMWRGLLDSVMAAVLVVLAVGADLMLWPLTAAVPGFGATSYVCDSSGPCGPTVGVSTTDLWIGVGVQTLVLAILLVASAHWVWRLRPESAQQKANRLGMVAVAALFVAALVAIDTNIDTSSHSPGQAVPDFSSSSSSGGSAPASNPSTVELRNDLGKSVEVVFCPHQNCRGQAARTMKPDAGATFSGTGGSIPDSFVVLGDGPPLCQTTDMPTSESMGHSIQTLSTADPTTCGMDVQTLTVPH